MSVWKASSVWEGDVPFTEGGKFLSYPTSYSFDPVVFKKSFTFDDKMKVVGIERGRSAARFELESMNDGRKYTMFMRDLLDIIQNVGIRSGGIIEGKFGFRKRGSNYGVCLTEGGVIE